MSRDCGQYSYLASCEVDNNSSSSCEFLIGNVTKEIQISKDCDACEIRADLVVNRANTVRVWGQVKDCQGVPVKHAMLKLVREVKGDDGRGEFIGIAHGVSDCLGFYQFDICAPTCSVPSSYRILVSKQALGKEIYMKATECDPCKDTYICVK